MSQNYRKTLSRRKNIVIKIGSSVLVDEKSRLSASRCRKLAEEIAELWEQNYKIILVSSGAIAAGMDRLDRIRQPHKIAVKQALAATGQTALMYQYEKAFARHHIPVAQVLLTLDDLANRQRFLNARHTLYELLKLSVLPIVNENDTVAVHEIKVGDNDNLSALVTNLVEANLLINLSDVDGVFEQDPRIDPQAKRLSVIEGMDAWLKKKASDTLRVGSTGGMITKLEAAEKAQRFGAATVIANGRVAGILQKVIRGEDVGTLIVPKEGQSRLSAKKYWLTYGLKSRGEIIVDAGAKQALLKRGKSLLPSGIQKINGNFRQGDPVDLADASGKTFARGLTSYSSTELMQILGCKTKEIESVLGYKYSDEAIHRNDLVLL